jgi:DNA-binding response OmpR family regulator
MSSLPGSTPALARGGALIPSIAVVDDEAATREMVGDYLKLHGFSVVPCDGGRSLREHLAHSTPDLVVLDLNMPEEDGLSIVRDLKAHTAIPIIMLTATASAIDRVVGLELGADDYLPKPCAASRALSRRQRRRRSRTRDGASASGPSGSNSMPCG